MANQEDVRRIALSLPEAVEETARFAFAVPNGGRLKAFAWVWLERVEAKKARVPNFGVLAVKVGNQEEKDLLLSADSTKFFTESHYESFPAVLVRLSEVDVDDWMCC